MFKDSVLYNNVPKTVENNEMLVNLAHELISVELKRKKIKESDFINHKSPDFSPQRVEHDIERTEEKRGLMYERGVSDYGVKGAELMEKVTEIFEFLFYNQVKNHQWLNGGGEEFTAYLASEFDDVNNGVDVILEKKKRIGEIDGENNIYGAAIDVTNSSFPAVVERKITDIEEKIFNSADKQDGKKRLPRIKYFKSELTGQKGPIDAMANMVVGASYEHVLGLFEDVFHDQLVTGPAKTELHESGESHPFNLMVLEQIFAQTYYLKLYSRYFGAPELENKYAKLRNCADLQFRKMLDSYEDKYELKKYLNEDASHQLVMKTIDEKLEKLLALVKEDEWRSVFQIRKKPDLRLFK